MSRLPRRNRPSACPPSHSGGIGEWVVEVQNPNGLAKGIDHVMIAIGMERIAAVVASDRDGYAALTHFKDRRDTAPARRPSATTVLKIQIYRRQRYHRDTRLGAEVEGPADLLFGLDRKAATMATNHATLESIAQNRSGDMRERGRRRNAALVHMQIDIETAR